MTSLIEDKLEEIKAICKAMQLQSLHLFGSGARANDFKKNSDLDFLFRFQTNEAGFTKSGYDYFDLLFKLEAVMGKKVDLIAEEKIKNRFFLEDINKDKICLYEA